jgi:hypothetical protein
MHPSRGDVLENKSTFDPPQDQPQPSKRLKKVCYVVLSRL